MTLKFPIKIDPIFKVKKNILFNFYKKTYFKKSSFLIKRWKWLYRLNFKKKIFSYILLKEKEIIGHAGKIPFDINIDNKKVLGSWFVDFSILKDYQNKKYGTLLVEKWMKNVGIGVTFCNDLSLSSPLAPLVSV